MRHYKYLTLVERECIALFHSFGYSVTTISNILRRNKATISHE
ncbi:MAG: helix-turn-helix domain-containing protein, partial [Phascolarctobacterium sp.]|nr:helix-turn-helix domain-containing protein [Candidatus Phascolarctobacterium caballi]